MDSLKFHLINVVWGDAYINLFLNLCLPTQLSPGNIPVFRQSKESVYKIYTTAKDAEAIVKHPVYSVLSKAIDTQIKVFNLSEECMKYSHTIMNYCHQHAIAEANRDDAILIVLCPDTIWSDETFVNLFKIVETGYRVIAVPNLSVVTESFGPAFLKKFGIINPTTISVSSRDLVKMTLEHLHPFIKSYIWTSQGINNIWPSYFYWNVENSGLIARCFRQHPLMIYPEIKNVLSPDPIDSAYLSLSCPNINDFYVVEDSDRIFVVNLVEKDYYSQNILNDGTRLGINEASQWLKQYENTHVMPCHKLFFQSKIRIHTQPLSLIWQKIEEESDQVVDLILSKGTEK